MPKGPKGQTRPADVIGNAVHVMKIATGEVEDDPKNDKPDGRAKGGKARAAKLSPEKRSEIAKKAAASRWGEKGAQYPTEDNEPNTDELLETFEYLVTLVPDEAEPTHRERIAGIRRRLNQLFVK